MQHCPINIMSIAVDVGLLSGRAVSVEAGLDESVATLKRRVQTALAVGKGRLFDSSARLLDEQQTPKKAKFEAGTSLTLQVAGKVCVAGNGFALSVILGNASVVAWGRQRRWRQQSCCARSAERRAADLSLSTCFCCYPVRWIRCYLVRPRLWW